MARKRNERSIKKLTKALSHPIRMRALIVLSDRVASPNEIAKEIEEPLGVVSYHVRQLLDLDCIELVKTEQRRGATEHYYRATERAIFDQGWDALPKETRSAISGGLLSDIWRDVGRAITAGTFDKKTGRHLSWTNLTLDEEGWEAVNERLAELVMWALDLQAETAERVANGESAIVSKLTLMHYPAPTKARARKSAKTGRRRTSAKA